MTRGQSPETKVAITEQYTNLQVDYIYRGQEAQASLLENEGPQGERRLADGQDQPPGM